MDPLSDIFIIIFGVSIVFMAVISVLLQIAFRLLTGVV